MLKRITAIFLLSAMLCTCACKGKKNETENGEITYTVNVTDTSENTPSEDTSDGASDSTDGTSGTQSGESDGSDITSDKPADGTENGEQSSGTSAEIQPPESDSGTDGVGGTEDEDEAPPVEENVLSVKFSHNAGVYSNSFKLTLTAPDGYEIYYTTDGSDPRVSGKKYTEPLSVNDTSAMSAGPLTKLNFRLNGAGYSYKSLPGGVVVKAFAKKGVEGTGVVTNTYFVIKNASSVYGVPFISISLKPSDFLSTDDGIYYTVMQNPFATKERRNSTVEIFESDGYRVGVSYAELAMNGNGSLGKASKSMRLYLKNSPYGDPGDGKLRYDIFLGHAEDGVNEFKRLLLRNSGNDSSYAHLRDAFMQRLCEPLDLPIMASRTSLVFVNGEFWGVYNLRERFDSKYFKEHYGIPEEDLVMLEAPSPLTTNWVVNEPYVLNEGLPGDEIPFYELEEYIKTHDMSNTTHYNYVCEQLDVDNMIDFFVASIYLGNTDWPTNNIKVFRSKNTLGTSGEYTKWRYVISDTDMGCGYAGTYSDDVFAHALNENTVAGTMFVRLLNNSEFKQKFLDRMVQCAEEIFAPERATQVLDEMAGIMENVIGLHFDRWLSDGGSMELWKSEIAEVREYVQNRPTYIYAQLSQYYGVTRTQAMFSVDLSKAQLTVGGKEITKSGYSTVVGNSQTVNVKITPKSGYVCTGISVTDANGKTTVYNKNSININITQSVTVVGMVSKSTLTVKPKIEAGSRSVFVLDANGNLYAWGKNELSQTGVFTTGALLTPTFVASGVVDVAISRGGTEGDAPHTLILTDTGRVMSVGNNSAGQLGRGGDSYVLTDIGFSSKVKAIAAGFDHTLILAENGDLYGCGNNTYGQVGAYSLGSAVTEFKKLASSVSKIAAGRRHTLYITTSGKLYALGDNRWNKLSSSASEKITTPFLLASNAKEVYAGQHNSLYINTSGELYYFGWRDAASFVQGQSSGTMNKIADGVKEASMMDDHIIFLKTNGDVYGYGWNDYCQISSDKQFKGSAYKILSGCIDITAGTRFSAAIKTDGSVVVWGSNEAGVFCNGTLTGQQGTPKKVTAVEVK